MLPCARSCAGKKLSPWSTIHSEHTAIEPLLFLYPTWYRSAIQQSQIFGATQTRVFSNNSKPRSSVTATAEVEDNDERPTPTTGSCTKQSAHPYRESRNVSLKPQSEPPEILTSQTTIYSFTSKRRRVTAQQAFRTVLSEDGLTKSRTYNPAEINGLRLATKLASISTIAPDTNEEIVWADPSFLQWLIGTSEDNIWKHADGSGCIIHAHPASPNKSVKRKIVLTGTPRAREIADQHLKSMEAVFRKEESNTTDQKPGEFGNMVESQRKVPVDQHPRPKIWSLRSLYEYVKCITELRQPKSVERVLYPETDSYHKRVGRILIDVFSDPALRPFLSSIALRQALEFICVRTEMSVVASTIWGEYKQAQLIPDIGCYNAEIARCLRYGNGASIAYLIRDMENARVKPNATTWALFFEFLHDGQEQRKFLNMLVHGRTPPSVESQKIIVQALTLREFKPNDKDRRCVSAFDQRMRRTFGDTWLTPKAAQTMIEMSIRAHAHQTISKIMELANAASVGIDSGAMNALSYAVAQTDHFSDTTTLLKMQQSDSDVRRQQERIGNAFRQAWRQRSVNTCKVLWHYAASHGYMTDAMARRVARNLTQNVHPATGQQRSEEARMAAVIIDASSLELESSGKFDLLKNGDPDLDVLEALTKWAPVGQQRNQQMELAHLVIERQLTAWQRVESMHYDRFLELLNEAQKLDREWSESETMTKSPLPTLVQGSVLINLTPLSSESQARVSDQGSLQVPSDTIPTRDTAEGVALTAVPSALPQETKKLHSRDQTTPSLFTSNRPPIEPSNHVLHNFRPSFNTCPASDATATAPLPSSLSSSSATTAAATFGPNSSISLLDVLLQYLRLGWEK